MISILGAILIIAIFIRGIPFLIDIIGWLVIIGLIIFFPPFGIFCLFLLLFGLFSK